MSAFKNIETKLTVKHIKSGKQPKPKLNVYDTGTAAERMARHAQPLPIERSHLPNRVSTM